MRKLNIFILFMLVSMLALNVKARLSAGVKLMQFKHSDLYATLNYSLDAHEFKFEHVFDDDVVSVGLAFVPRTDQLFRLYEPNHRDSLAYDYDMIYNSRDEQVSLHAGFGLNKHLCLPLDVSYSGVGKGTFAARLGVGLQGRALFWQGLMAQGRIYPYAGVNYTSNAALIYGAAARVGMGVKIAKYKRSDLYFMFNYMLDAPEFEPKGMFDNGYWGVGLSLVPKSGYSVFVGTKNNNESIDYAFNYNAKAEDFGLQIGYNINKLFVAPLDLSYSHMHGDVAAASLGLGLQKQILPSQDFLLQGRVYPYLGVGICSGAEPELQYGAVARATVGARMTNGTTGNLYATLSFQLSTPQFKTDNMFGRHNWIVGLAYVPKHSSNQTTAHSERNAHDVAITYMPDKRLGGVQVGVGLSKYVTLPVEIGYGTAQGGMFNASVGLGVQGRMKLGSHFLFQGRAYPYINLCSAEDVLPDITSGVAASAGFGVKIANSTSHDIFLTVNYKLFAPEFNCTRIGNNGSAMLGLTFIPR